MRHVERTSLPDQAVTLLRAGIDAARWRRELPSEAELCHELHVSRGTLRKALAQLVREQWLTSGGRGRRHSIRHKPSRRAEPTGQIVRVLAPCAHAWMGSVQHAALETLTEHLSKQGYRVEFEHRPQLFQRHQPAKLRELEVLPDTAGWVLFYSTEPMQRWFASHGSTCVVAGPLYDGVMLSSVYPDTQALARHAVGRLCGRGYRELVCFASASSLGGRRGAAAFVGEARRLGAARLVEVGDDAPPVREAVFRLLAQRPRPNGFLVFHAGHIVTVLCGLLAAGVRIPADAAVISGWDDTILDFTTPIMARYRIDGVAFGRKLARVILDQLRHGAGKRRTVRILPEFVPGGTLEE